MSNLIVTLTNPSPEVNNNWIVAHTPYDEEFCTPDEILNTVIHFRNYVMTLPGYQNLTVTPNANSLIINYTFDTIENANNANVELYSDSETQNNIVINSQKLILNYRKLANTFYSRTITVS
jgi:hypothetical protein